MRIYCHQHDVYFDQHKNTLCENIFSWIIWYIVSLQLCSNKTYMPVCDAISIDTLKDWRCFNGWIVFLVIDWRLFDFVIVRSHDKYNNHTFSYKTRRNSTHQSQYTSIPRYPTIKAHSQGLTASRIMCKINVVIKYVLSYHDMTQRGCYINHYGAHTFQLDESMAVHGLMTFNRFMTIYSRHSIDFTMESGAIQPLTRYTFVWTWDIPSNTKLFFPLCIFWQLNGLHRI